MEGLSEERKGANRISLNANQKGHMLAQKLVLSYGAKMIAQFILVGAGIIVARVAGPSVLGTMAFGLAYVSTFIFIADLGTGSAHIKMISGGEDLGKCISTYSVLKVVSICIYLLVIMGIYLTQKYIFKIAFESYAHEFVILIMIIIVTIDQVLLIPKTTFMGKTEQAKQDLPDLLKSLINNISRVIIVLLGPKLFSCSIRRA